MRCNKFLFSVLFLLVLSGCNNNSETDKFSYNLGVIGAFSELVNSGTKQLALSATLTSEEMDAFIDDTSGTLLSIYSRLWPNSDPTWEVQSFLEGLEQDV